MFYKCEYCAAIDDRDNGDPDEFTVDPYLIGSKVVFCCGNCLEGNLPMDTRQPFVLPEDWEIVPKLALREVKRGNEAFRRTSSLIRADAEKMMVSLNYHYDLDNLYQRVRDRYEAQYSAEIAFRRSIGIDSMSEFSRLNSHCPNCGNRLIRLSGCKSSNALADFSDSPILCGGITDEMIKYDVLSCLRCRIAYISKNKK